MKDASCFLWAPGPGGLLSCSPRVAVRPGGKFIVGLPGLTAEWGALWLARGYGSTRGYGSLCMPPGFTQSCLGGFCSLVWAGSPSPLRVSPQCSASWPDGSTRLGLEPNNYYYSCPDHQYWCRNRYEVFHLGSLHPVVAVHCGCVFLPYTCAWVLLRTRYNERGWDIIIACIADSKYMPPVSE